jgi:hypothetical protein
MTTTTTPPPALWRTAIDDVRKMSEAWKGTACSAELLGEVPDRLELDRIQACAARLVKLRDLMRASWLGLHLDHVGYLTDWLLAALIGRENPLLLGPPGVAKSEIAEQVLTWLGLSKPGREVGSLRPFDEEGSQSFRQWWEEREASERSVQKYFHFLLSRFTQPEELFGPVEIEMLRRGVLVRVNFGLLTGPGVRGAFIDEVFKAGSSILNTLLTLMQERTYFNWGGMQPSDLVALIGASNEMPGGLELSGSRRGGAAEEFDTLWAFLDRFCIRLDVPVASGQFSDGKPMPPGDAQGSDLGKATAKSLEREAARFCTNSRWGANEVACINDVLLLGRACLQDLRAEVPKPNWTLFVPEQQESFNADFFKIAAQLQDHTTDTRQARITWTITPRKLKGLYKVALAHALLIDDDFARKKKTTVALDGRSLFVFAHIWDAWDGGSLRHRLIETIRQKKPG